MPDHKAIENLLEKIKKIKPDILDRKLENWSEVFTPEIESFAREVYWCDSDSVNIFLVKGTQHPDYVGMTWIEFLEKGKRMSLNLGLYQSNPGYYFTSEKKLPTIYLKRINGGDYYIGEDGNHRTCIAKSVFFLESLTNLHGVCVTDYRIDRESLFAFTEVTETLAKRNLQVKITPTRKLVRRDDSAGWKKDIYKIGFEVSQPGKEKLLLQSVSELKRTSSEILKKKSFFRKFF